MEISFSLLFWLLILCNRIVGIIYRKILLGGRGVAVVYRRFIFWLSFSFLLSGPHMQLHITPFCVIHSAPLFSPASASSVQELRAYTLWVHAVGSAYLTRPLFPTSAPRKSLR